MESYTVCTDSSETVWPMARWTFHFSANESRGKWPALSKPIQEATEIQCPVHHEPTGNSKQSLCEFSFFKPKTRVVSYKLLFHTFSVSCPRNWRDLYGNPTKFSRVNQRTISYVPDLLAVTKRHKGQQTTSCWYLAAFTTTVRNPDKESARQLF